MLNKFYVISSLMIYMIGLLTMLIYDDVFTGFLLGIINSLVMTTLIVIWFSDKDWLAIFINDSRFIISYLITVMLLWVTGVVIDSTKPYDRVISTSIEYIIKYTNNDHVFIVNNRLVDLNNSTVKDSISKGCEPVVIHETHEFLVHSKYKISKKKCLDIRIPLSHYVDID